MTSVFSPVQHGGVGPVVHLAGQKKRMPPQAAAHGRLQGLLGNIREGVRGTDADVTQSCEANQLQDVSRFKLFHGDYFLRTHWTHILP